MQSLPVIYRELRVAARRPATYRQRLSLGGVAAGAVILFAFFNPSPQSGQTLFRLVSWSLFAFCILEGLRQTADSLAQERREGTLGMLLLTDLGFFDLVLGKLAAAAVKSLTALLSVLPAIILPILLGGVTAQQCFQVSVALALTLFISMASGLFVSAKTSSSFAAFLFSVFLVVMLLFLPVALSVAFDLPGWTSGPFEMLSQVFSNRTGAGVQTFWLATFYSALLSVGLLWLSSRALARNVHDDATFRLSEFWQRLLKPSVGLSEAWGGSVSNSPAVWLAERSLPGRRILWMLLGAVILICFVIGTFGGKSTIFALFPIQILFGWLIKLWMAAVAIQPFHNARRSGALEQLLCTPLSSSDLVRSHVDALRGYFFAPVLIASFAPTIAMALGNSFSSNSTGGELTPGIMLGVFWFLIFLLDIHALAYTGLWFGLTEAQLPQAMTKTVFRVIILPLLTLLVPLLGFLGLFLWPACWISLYAKKLNRQFHQEAGSYSSAQGTRPGWFLRMVGRIFKI